MKTITLTQHEIFEQTKTVIHKNKKKYTRSIKHKKQDN
jgi:hypothetical protein